MAAIALGFALETAILTYLLVEFGEENGGELRIPDSVNMSELIEAANEIDAGLDIKENILKIGIRKLERDTGVSHHTLNKILKGEHVRRKTLAKIVKQLPLYRETGTTEFGQ